MYCLLDLFERYGTDKGRNGYHTWYEDVLADRRESIRYVLEVGIGTLVPSAHSSMVGYGADHYQPRGSLRAWRDYLPNAVVVGMDTQPDTQFTDDRIVTVCADSTDPRQVESVLTGNFDLIIDDGDHVGVSQISTFCNLWPHLNDNGLYVIEDISDEGVGEAVSQFAAAALVTPHLLFATKTSCKTTGFSVTQGDAIAQR